MAKKAIQHPLEAAPTRTDRIIVSIAIMMIVITVLAFIALFIANVHAEGGIWPTIQILPLIALPTALILFFVLIGRTAIRRSRDARDAGK